MTIHVFGRTLSRTPSAASNAFPTGVRRTALWSASTMTGGTRLFSSARSSGFCATCATTRAANEFSTKEYALVGARNDPFTRYKNSRRAAASTPHARVACATCRKSFGMPYECTCAFRGGRSAPRHEETTRRWRAADVKFTHRVYRVEDCVAGYRLLREERADDRDDRYRCEVPHRRLTQ